MNITHNKKYCRIETGCCSFQIRKSHVLVAAGVALAYNIPTTRVYIKPLVDFTISLGNVVWYHKTTLLALTVLYFVMKHTGLLKVCKRACNNI